MVRSLSVNVSELGQFHHLTACSCSTFQTLCALCDATKDPVSLMALPGDAWSPALDKRVGGPANHQIKQ